MFSRIFLTLVFVVGFAITAKSQAIRTPIHPILTKIEIKGKLVEVYSFKEIADFFNNQNMIRWEIKNGNRGNCYFKMGNDYFITKSYLKQLAINNNNVGFGLMRNTESGFDSCNVLIYFEKIGQELLFKTGYIECTLEN